MALTLVESLVLWGVPILTILISLGYYFYWGKEADAPESEAGDEPEPATDGGSA